MQADFTWGEGHVLERRLGRHPRLDQHRSTRKLEYLCRSGRTHVLESFKLCPRYLSEQVPPINQIDAPVLL
jgi:hypothetical protein